MKEPLQAKAEELTRMALNLGAVVSEKDRLALEATTQLLERALREAYCLGQIRALSNGEAP